MLPGTGREAGIHGVVLARVAGRVSVGNVATDGQINIFQIHKVYSNGSHGDIAAGRFAGDETTPGVVTFVDNSSGIFLVFCFTGESKFVLGLAIRDLVDPIKKVR